MQVESSCSSRGSNALGVRRDRRKRQPSWMKFLRPEHLQERDCWFAVHMITTGGLDLLAVHNAVSKACVKVPLSGFVGRIGGSGPGHTFTSANGGLACTFRFSKNPALMHVFNPFKSEAFQVNIPPKTVIYTAAVVPKTRSKEFKVVAVAAEFGEVVGVYIYESETKVWRLSWNLKPLQYLVFYSCNVVVGNVFCFMAKSGRDGYLRVLFYDMEAEALTEENEVPSLFGEDGVPEYAESILIVAPNLFLCKGKLTMVDTVLTGSPSFSGGSEDEDEEEEVDAGSYSEVIVWQMDEQTRKWEEVAKMPDDLWNKLHSSCDMYSKLKVCGAGKFVFMQFEHWTPFEHRPEEEHAVICNLETGVWEVHPPKPSTIKYSQCLDVVALDPDQSFAL